jgi:hypothetical protein
MRIPTKARLRKIPSTGCLPAHQHSLDALLRKWINDPAVALFPGLAIVDGKPPTRSLAQQQNDSVTVNLDQYTHLPLKTSFSWRDPEDKQKNIEDEVYDNYRLVQGIMTPHSSLATSTGTVAPALYQCCQIQPATARHLFETTVNYDPKQPLKKRKHRLFAVRRYSNPASHPDYLPFPGTSWPVCRMITTDCGFCHGRESARQR